MDVTVVNSIISAVALIFGAIIGAFIQYFVLKKNQENNKYNQKLDTYSRLDKKLSNMIDLYGSFGGMYLQYFLEEKISAQLGVDNFDKSSFDGVESKKGEMHVYFPVNIEINLCIDTIKLIDEALLISKKDTKVSLNELRMAIMNTISGVRVNNTPIELYNVLKRIELGDKDKTTIKDLYVAATENLAHITQICRKVKQLISRELM